MANKTIYLDFKLRPSSSSDADYILVHFSCYSWRKVYDILSSNFSTEFSDEIIQCRVSFMYRRDKQKRKYSYVLRSIADVDYFISNVAEVEVYDE